jgi:hypothetical protein
LPSFFTDLAINSQAISSLKSGDRIPCSCPKITIKATLIIALCLEQLLSLINRPAFGARE